MGAYALSLELLIPIMLYRTSVALMLADGRDNQLDGALLKKHFRFTEFVKGIASYCILGTVGVWQVADGTAYLHPTDKRDSPE